MIYFASVPPSVGMCFLGALLRLQSLVVLLRQQAEGQVFQHNMQGLL